MAKNKFIAKMLPQDDAIETLSISAIVLILLLAGYGALSLVGKVVIAMESAQQTQIDTGNHLPRR